MPTINTIRIAQTTFGVGSYGVREKGGASYTRPIIKFDKITDYNGVEIRIQPPASTEQIKISTRAFDTNIKSLNFVYNKYGSIEGKLILNNLPSDTIPALTKVYIYLSGNFAQPVWGGVIINPPQLGTPKTTYTVNLQGWKKAIEQVRVYENNSADRGTISNTTIGSFIGQLFRDAGTALSNIIDTSDLSGIDTAISSLVYAGFIEKAEPLNLAEFLDLLSVFSGGQWGIFPDGRFYFKSRETVPDKLFSEGYDGIKTDIRTSFSSVVNSWVVELENNLTGDTKFGAIAQDLASQSTYNVRQKRFTYKVSNQDYTRTNAITIAQSLADKLLANTKDPTESIKIKEILIPDLSSVPRGTNITNLAPKRWVSRVKPTTSVIWDGDFSQVGSGGKAVRVLDGLFSRDTNFYFSGGLSLKLIAQQAFSIGSYVVDVSFAIKNLLRYSGLRLVGSTLNFIRLYNLSFYVYIQAPEPTPKDYTFQLITTQQGADGATTNIAPEITVKLNAWVNLKTLFSRELGRYQFGGFLCHSTKPFTIFLDSISANVLRSEIKEGNMLRSSYTVSPQGNLLDVEIGDEVPRLENYLKEVQSDR